MDILKVFFVMFISFSSGAVISSAVFAFIASIGVVPTMAVRTDTTKYVKLYEEMIIFGGIFGCVNTIVDYSIFSENSIFGVIVIIIFFIAIGIFVGVLASSLAEVIDVIPIFSKRMNIKKGIALLILSMALGKCVGSILYFINNGFQV